MKFVDFWQISKDNMSFVSESKGEAGALLWIHRIIVTLKIKRTIEAVLHCGVVVVVR